MVLFPVGSSRHKVNFPIAREGSCRNLAHVLRLEIKIFSEPARPRAGPNAKNLSGPAGPERNCWYMCDLAP
jgi:hypothetical protein